VPLSDDFKDALACWASGVSVVTAATGGLHHGLTVSSFTSLSLAPPLVLVCLGNGNPLPEAIAAAGAFGVSVLRADQQSISDHFAVAGRAPTDGFGEVPGEWLAAGVPAVSGALAQLACQHVESLVRGDHTIVIGEVTAAVAQAGEPLIYWERDYRRIGPR
jgi:flavin reductase (DIM6/NTAB) family NADH-FMN oxidoreductase RutF